MESIRQDSRFTEATVLAGDIVRDIEQDNAPLDLLCLKSSRLALLLNDPKYSEVFTKLAYNAGECVAHLDAVGERFDKIQDEPKRPEDPMKRAALSSLSHEYYRQEMRSYEDDPVVKRKREMKIFQESKQKLSLFRTQVYKYALDNYYKLRFSDIPEHVFAKTRLRVDNHLGKVLPDSKEKFYSVYSNLESNNPEDWANAVHSCRRILQALADKLYPPQDGKTVEKNGKSIKIGSTHYLNRIKQYVESKSESRRFKEIVGSHTEYLWERLDAVYEATNKGSHGEISQREEAERYIIFTYLLIGDILSL